MERESLSGKSFTSKSKHRVIVDNIKRSMLKCNFAYNDSIAMPSLILTKVKFLYLASNA